MFALLLVFVAQTAAAVPSSCAMKGELGSATDLTPLSDHAHHGHHVGHEHTHPMVDSAEVLSSTEDGCCEPDGACSMNSCIALNALPNTPATPLTQLSPAKIEFSGQSFASAALASLYRPPISH